MVARGPPPEGFGPQGGRPQGPPLQRDFFTASERGGISQVLSFRARFLIPTGSGQASLGITAFARIFERPSDVLESGFDLIFQLPNLFLFFCVRGLFQQRIGRLNRLVALVADRPEL